MFRANSKYAAIYDTSYFASIFLLGKFVDVAAYLNLFIDPLDPIKSQVGGRRMIFSDFPGIKIGPVSFFWNEDKCWLSVHPCILKDILQLFEKNRNSNVKLEVSDEFARFELTGPQSLQVLKTSLNLVQHQDVYC
jgi:hypothetical protein